MMMRMKINCEGDGSQRRRKTYYVVAILLAIKILVFIMILSGRTRNESEDTARNDPSTFPVGSSVVTDMDE
jgi:hypothetical protein